MNLNQPSVSCERMVGSAPTPVQESLSTVLDHSLEAIGVSLKNAEAMLQHVGAPTNDEKMGQAQIPGALGKSFELRTCIHRLNAKLEQLAALL